MNPLMLLQLLPTVIKLMDVAEKVGGPGTGPQKKEAVKQGVKAIAGGMVAVSGGGQKETWKGIGGLIDSLSDLF